MLICTAVIGWGDVRSAPWRLELMAVTALGFRRTLQDDIPEVTITV